MEEVKTIGQGSLSLPIICGLQSSSSGTSSEVSEGQLLTGGSGRFCHCPANNQLSPHGLHREYDPSRHCHLKTTQSHMERKSPVVSRSIQEAKLYTEITL